MPTISFSGVASGLDTQSIVAQLMALRRRPITLLETQKQDIQRGMAALTDLESALSRLETAAKRLDESNEFASKAASSSDEGVFLADADAVAALGNFQVTVTNLAQTHRDYSQAFADPTRRYGVPLIYDLHTDPKEATPLHSSWYNNGWIRWPAGQASRQGAMPRFSMANAFGIACG